MDKEIGKVIHYFDKAMVAVIRLTDGLVIGDSVKFVQGESEFTQIVDSMEIEHKKIQSAKKGDEVAVKVEQKAKEGTRVCKVE
jgi:putative protease